MPNNHMMSLFARIRLTLVVLVSVSSAALITSCHPGMRSEQGFRVEDGIRAIWVTRWDYKTSRDITTIMDNAKRSGFNTVLFQVRGNGTAFYRSTLEPWADELGGRDPGFDPLTVACQEAHRRGLSLHAWVNVMPGWRDKEPPTNRRQLYHARADWFWRDANGRRQPLGWYNSLNPCYPEVRQYLVAVMREIVSRYPVDGLHLDYIRFPNEWNESYPRGAKVPDYPRDPRTLTLFKRDTGKTPDTSPQLWLDWRANQVTQLVRDIRNMCRRVKPQVILSAAVGITPREAYRKHYQDSLRWIQEGLLDAVYPMNYTKQSLTFATRASFWKKYQRDVMVVMGIRFEQHDSKTVIEQIQRTRTITPHFAAFAYNSLFERTHEKPSAKRDGLSGARTALRKNTLPYLRRVAQQGY